MSLCFYRSTPKIQAMTFDLDDTLYDNYPVIVHLEAKMLTWLHQNFPKTEQITLAQWQQWKRDALIDEPDLRHDVTLWRCRQLSLGFASLGYDEASCQHMVDQTMTQVMLLRHQVSIPDLTHQVLKQLARKIPLIAITNGNLDPQRVGLASYFQTVFSAGPDGYAKPNRQMFDLALAELNCEAAEVLHVGDHLISDVQGAKQAGLSACWIHTPQQRLSQQRVTCLPDVAISSLADLKFFID